MIILSVIVGGGILWYAKKQEKPYQPPEIKKPEKVALNPKNCTYIIEGKSIAIKDGYSEEEIVPGSASKVITQYFGNEASGDFNGDGLSDIAFILTQSPGGSGTFYYIVVALGDANGCKGTNAILLGDRIAPQTTEIRDVKVIVNYSDRRIDEAMVTSLSIGITKQFALEGTTLKDVTPEEAKKEQACALSGGIVSTASCCKSNGDFPESCLIGACGCSPTNSHQVKVCDCGINKCFDGVKCVSKEATEGETADWKTYRNEEYGYEIKYPEDWVLDISGYPKEVSFADTPSSALTFTGIAMVPNTFTSPEEVESFFDVHSVLEVEKAREITINSLKGYEVVGLLPELDMKLRFVVISLKDKSFLINCMTTEALYDDLATTFDKIINSFSF